MSKWADYTVGLAIVVSHFVIMAMNEWRLNAATALPPPKS